MTAKSIALIAISSIIFLAATIHGNVFGSFITADNEPNVNQIQRYYTIASLINNQSSNKEIMNVLKSQLENPDPFKSRSDNEGNALNLTSADDGPFDRLSNDEKTNNEISNDEKTNNNNSECEFDCVESTYMRDNIPFELPSIPFP